MKIRSATLPVAGLSAKIMEFYSLDFAIENGKKVFHLMITEMVTLISHVFCIAVFIF